MSTTLRRWTIELEAGEFESPGQEGPFFWRATVIEKDGARRAATLGLSAHGVLTGILRDLELEDPG